MDYTIHGHFINLCTVILFNISQDSDVIWLHKIDGNTFTTKPTWAANPEIKIQGIRFFYYLLQAASKCPLKTEKVLFFFLFISTGCSKHIKELWGRGGKVVNCQEVNIELDNLSPPCLCNNSKENTVLL